jgi:hypothetical protein
MIFTTASGIISYDHSFGPFLERFKKEGINNDA